MGKFREKFSCKRSTVEKLAELALEWGDGFLVIHQEVPYLGVWSPTARVVQYGAWLEADVSGVDSGPRYFRALTDDELEEIGFINYEAINLGTGDLVYTDECPSGGDLWIYPEPVGPDEDWFDDRGGEWAPETWFRINTWPEAPLEPEPEPEAIGHLDGIPAFVMPPSPGVSDLDAVAIVLGEELVESGLRFVQAAKLARQAYWAELGEPRKSEPKLASLTAWVRALEAASGHLQEG